MKAPALLKALRVPSQLRVFLPLLVDAIADTFKTLVPSSMQSAVPLLCREGKP